MSRFDTEFKLIGKIGQNLFKMRHKLDKKEYAVRKATIKTERSLTRAMREIETVSEFDHPNVVIYKNSRQESGPNEEMILYIQMQLCDHDLEYWLEENPQPRDRRQQLRILHELLCGMEYIHAKGYIHRNLKPQNVFFLDGRVKLGDFGLVKEAKDKHSTLTTDMEGPDYRSPELLAGKTDYNRKIDIYALGIIFFEMFNPVDFPNEYSRGNAIERARRFEFPNFTDKMAAERELITKMLDPNPNERPNARKIRKQSLFSSISS